MAQTCHSRRWSALLVDADELVEECRYASAREFYDGTRTLRDALGALVKGHLAGLFDAPAFIRREHRRRRSLTQ